MHRQTDAQTDRQTDKQKLETKGVGMMTKLIYLQTANVNQFL